ncbi:Tubulin-specific chaperone C [Trichinella britovi]|uniref:Tubulin-specific chaperone C n=2 Tax=Trichinella britovi TaxID=45882 RepID=A0A0V1CM87_TRIBR|nr:Tubulin-specific chaperone C [Trichinella britovi]
MQFSVSLFLEYQRCSCSCFNEAIIAKMSDKKSEAQGIMEQINRDVDEIADMIYRVQIIPKVMRNNFIGHIQLKLERVRLTLAENRASLPSRDLQRLGKKLSTYDNKLRNEAVRKRKKWPNRKDDSESESEEEFEDERVEEIEEISEDESDDEREEKCEEESEKISEEKGEKISDESNEEISDSEKIYFGLSNSDTTNSEQSDSDNNHTTYDSTEAQLLKSLSDRQNAEICIKLPAELPQAVRIRNVKDCTIAICCLSPAADLYLVRDSIIIMYPVRTSVMIESCINCTIACAAQQIRVKDCINCRLFLYTTGTTLLEECNAIEIGPYNVNFPQKEEIFKEGGFGGTENKWKDVEDLKMVNKGTPAFTLMNENELEEFEIE